MIGIVKNGLVWATIFLIFGADVVFAAESPDYSRNLGPNRLQKDTNWCFAFAGSDALSYALGYSPDEQISAVDFAVQGRTSDYSRLSVQLNELALQKGLPQVFSKTPRSVLESQMDPGTLITENSGYSLTTVAANLENDGYCEERIFPGLEFNRTTEPVIELLERRAGYTYLEILKKFVLKKAIESNCKIDQTLVLSAHKIDELGVMLRNCSVQLSENERHLLSQKKMKAGQSLRNAVGKTCTRRPVKAEIKVVYSIRPDSIVATISLLGKWLRLAPVLITIGSDYLRGEQFRYANHEVLVVAEQGSGAELMYKIRNPWPCEALGRPELRGSCMNGEFWIKADQLVAIMGELAMILPNNFN